MTNVISLYGDPVPVAEAPMAEWVEPTREPIVIRVQLPDPPRPVSSGVGMLIVQGMVGAILGLTAALWVLS